MSDNAPQDPSAQNPGGSQNPPDPAPQMNDSLESLPQSWQKHIKELRTEGQNKGARISALESEIATAKSDAETRVNTATQQLSESQMELARFRAAVTSVGGIDVAKVDSFASRLRGSNPDELTADAAELAKHFQTSNPAPEPDSRRGVDPSAGRGNSDSVNNGSLASQLQTQIHDLLGRS